MHRPRTLSTLHLTLFYRGTDISRTVLPLVRRNWMVRNSSLWTGVFFEVLFNIHQMNSPHQSHASFCLIFYVITPWIESHSPGHELTLDNHTAHITTQHPHREEESRCSSTVLYLFYIYVYLCVFTSSNMLFFAITINTFMLLSARLWPLLTMQTPLCSHYV